MKTRILATILILIGSFGYAQNPPKVASGSIKRIENFQSKFVEARNVDVWLPDGYDTAGQYVFDLPVSTEVSVKGGRGIWGMPKHQASLDFKTGSHWVSAQYDLDGQMVSRFDVKRPASAWLPLSMGAANYCVFRGMMMKSLIYFSGKAGVHLLKPGSARLILGNHPRADTIRNLDVDPNPMFAAYIPNVLGVLDDYFECWFVTPEAEPAEPIGAGLEATYPLGYSQDWLAPPARDPNFNLNGD